MRTEAHDKAFDALPIERQRAWADGELRSLRLADAKRVVHEAEPLAPAHAAALGMGADALVDALAPDPLACMRALWDWRWWARPTQLAPTDRHWSIWLILSGRGWGKTRTGVEWVRERVQSGDAKSIGLIGASLSEVWDYLVYGTEAAPGLAKIFPVWERRVEVRRQDRKVVLHAPTCVEKGISCGCPVAKVYTAEEPEIRGGNHDTWLCDELAKWRYLGTIWPNIELTTRAKGRRPPRICVTTTPRPLAIIRKLLDDRGVRVTWGSTFANAANVSEAWLERMAHSLGGSRLGQQELFGQVLGDNPDAAFRQSWIDATRVTAVPALVRIVVSVDPSVSTSEASDLTGIAVLGVDVRGHVYVLADLTGVHFKRDKPGLTFWTEKEPKKHSANEWGELVCRAVQFFDADAVVLERNRGGDLVQSNMLSCWREALLLKLVSAPTVKTQEVHATKGKLVRAEPVAAMYEQGRMHHLDHLPEAETELTNWNPKMQNPGASPGRLDAIVWGTYALAGLDREESPPPPNFQRIADENQKLATTSAGGRDETTPAALSPYYAGATGGRGSRSI